VKQSHFQTPRNLAECYFDPRGQAIHRGKQTGYSWLAAIVYGILGALALVHWWSN
jgi:hypothetical protein